MTSHYIRDLPAADLPTLARYYRAACTYARSLRRTLAHAGIPPDAVRVTAGVESDGRPVVILTVTSEGLRLLRHASGKGSDPGPSIQRNSAAA
ncbi:hypothetical protein [Kribbella deserti]|uniref:MarR family transcriptional regulator n=1 Tax=Kribbella deserti TaxID=1926257 RepID=A0ABV6QUI3_9ACTN